MNKELVEKIIAKIKEIYKYDEIQIVGGQYIVSYDYNGEFSLRSVKWRGDKVSIVANKFEVLEFKGNDWKSKVIYEDWEGLLKL